MSSLDEKPHLEVSLDGEGYLHLKNDTVHDLRAFYTDDNGKDQSLLCNAKTTRKYDRPYKFIDYKDGLEIERLTLSTRTEFWGTNVRIEVRRNEKVESDSNSNWADIAADDDSTKELPNPGVVYHDSIEKQILKLQTSCVRNGFVFHYKIVKNNKIIYSNIQNR